MIEWNALLESTVSTTIVVALIAIVYRNLDNKVDRNNALIEKKVSKDVCNILSKDLKDDVKELKNDVKSLLTMVKKMNGGA